MTEAEEKDAGSRAVSRRLIAAAGRRFAAFGRLLLVPFLGRRVRAPGEDGWPWGVVFAPPEHRAPAAWPKGVVFLPPLPRGTPSPMTSVPAADGRTGPAGLLVPASVGGQTWTPPNGWPPSCLDQPKPHVPTSDRDAKLTKASELQNLGCDAGDVLGKGMPLFARTEVLEQIVRILLSDGLHPVLIGEPGVGKSAVVATLARTMRDDLVRTLRGVSQHRRLPEALRNRRIIAVTLSDLVAEALYSQQIEHKVKLIVENCRRAGAILFLDNVGMFAEAGACDGGGRSDIANLFTPFLARGTLRVIAAATPQDWMLLTRVRPAFTRCFTPVRVPETSDEETQQILALSTDVWLRRYRAILNRALIPELMDLADRLYPWKRFPGKACDLVEEILASLASAGEEDPGGAWREPNRALLGGRAAESLRGRGQGAAPAGRQPRAEVRGSDGGTRPAPSVVSRLAGGCTRVAPEPLRVGAAQVAGAIRRMTGLPGFIVDPSIPVSREQLVGLFHRRLVGQRHVVDPLVDRIQMFKAGLCAPGRPVAAYLFTGPSGVGKTLVARTLAEVLLGDERRLIRFDMSEYGTIDSLARFVGEQRYRRRSLGLVDAVLAEVLPVILLDEIEKAHPMVFDLLLQAFGEGRITDDAGRTAFLTNAFVVMTSNLGTSGASIEHPRVAGSFTARTDRVRDAVRRRFRPEFLNRLTGIFAFLPLQRSEIVVVAKREVRLLANRNSLRARELQLEVSTAALSALLKAGYSAEFGARPMERAVDQFVGTPLGRYLAESPEVRGCTLVVDVVPDFRPPADGRVASFARLPSFVVLARPTKAIQAPRGRGAESRVVH